MKEFLQRHASDVTGVLSGFDRLRLRGSLRVLCNVGGMMSFLSAAGVLLKDFKQYSLGVTEQVPVTRQLRLLRAHGLIRKVPRTHRYMVSEKGRTAITALLAARQADTATLAKAA